MDEDENIAPEEDKPVNWKMWAIGFGATTGVLLLILVMNNNLAGFLGSGSNSNALPPIVSSPTTNDGFITPPGIPPESEDVFGAPVGVGAPPAANQYTPSLDNVVRLASTNLANRRLSEFGIITDPDLYVLPTVYGNTTRYINGVHVPNASRDFYIRNSDGDIISDLDGVFVPRGAEAQNNFILVYYITTSGEVGIGRLFVA